MGVMSSSGSFANGGVGVVCLAIVRGLFEYIDVKIENSSKLISLAIAYSGLQDFVLALIPWFVIMKLQMRKKEKFGIAIAMSLGIL